MRKPLILSITLIVFLSISLEAQVGAREILLKDIPLRAEDKREILALLKGIDTRYYRFQSGREVYGSRKFTPTESKRIKELGAPDTKGIIIEYKETRSIIIFLKDGSILAATSPRGKTDPDVFVNLLGKQAADKLRDILSKYFVHDQDN